MPTILTPADLDALALRITAVVDGTEHTGLVDGDLNGLDFDSARVWLSAADFAEHAVAINGRGRLDDVVESALFDAGTIEARVDGSAVVALCDDLEGLVAALTAMDAVELADLVAEVLSDTMEVADAA